VFRVVLREALSSECTPLAKLINLSKHRRSSEISSAFPQVNGVDLRRYQMNRWLTRAEGDRVVQLYRNGKSMRDLAHQFGVHPTTVSATLRREGVELRKRGLDAGQIDEAVNLYAAGNSLARIGDHFGVDHGTVWRQLRKRGVKMRDTHGRPR